MTGGEERAIGELTGEVRSLIRQRAEEHQENLDKFGEVFTILNEIREHGTGAAAAIACDLDDFKQEFTRFRVDEHRPLVTRVESLEADRIAEGALAGIRKTQRNTRRWVMGLVVAVFAAVIGLVVEYMRIRYHT